MKENTHLRKIHLKLYFNYICIFILAIIICNLFLVSLNRKENYAKIKRELSIKGEILKNMSVEDIEYSINWMYAFSSLKSPVFYSGKARIPPYEKTLKSISESNVNIKEIFYLNKYGKKIRGFANGIELKEGIILSDDIQQKIKTLEKTEVYVETPLEDKGIMVFYKAIYIEKRIIGFLGTAYSGTSFLNKIDEEFKEVFYYDKMLTISSKGKKLYSSNMEINPNKIYGKVSTPYPIILGLKTRMEKKGFKLKALKTGKGDAVLNVYFLKGELNKNYAKYLDEELVLFFFIAFILWRYTKEMVNNLRYTKKLKIINRKLLKEVKNKELMFSIVGHDLRSPFTTMLGYFRLLDRNLEKYDHKKIKFMIETMKKDAESLSELTENLLKWSSIQLNRLEFRPYYISLKDIVDKIIRVYSSQLKNKNITLNYKKYDEAKVWADYNLTETIIRNIFSNAIKYSYFDNEIVIEIVEEKDETILKIEDFGVGISKEKLKSSKNGNYVSSKGTNNEKGIGFGLYVVDKFSKLNESKVEFESERGKGTRVKIRFNNKMKLKL